MNANTIEWFEAEVQAPIQPDGKQVFHMWGDNRPKAGEKVLVTKSNTHWIVARLNSRDLLSLTTEAAKRFLKSIRRNGKVVFTASQAGEEALKYYSHQMSI